MVPGSWKPSAPSLKLTPHDTPQRYPVTRAEKSWILYDVANSAFVLVIVTAIMPIYFKDVVAHGMPAQLTTAWWGYANSLSALLMVLLAPLLGTFADFSGWKKRFLLVFLLLGVAATGLLSLTGEGHVLFCLLVFVAARTCWEGTNLFYDALLIDVTEPERMDRLSAAGYAWGYIGSVVPFLAVIALILARSVPGGTLPGDAARLGFLIVAAWWLLFSIPLLKYVEQKYGCEKTAGAVRQSFSRLAETFRNVSRHRNAFLFLLAYFFYIDGVGTVITMAVAYGVDVGLDAKMLILVILVIQVVAFPAALLWGRLAGSFRVKPLLFCGIGIYCGITLMAFIIPAIPDLSVKKAAFWTLAVLVASSMGGIQALSRSFFGKLIPREQSAEFFGFYNMFGKFAAMGGPFLMGITAQMTGSSRYGVLSILVLFIVGSLILSKVDETLPSM